jgi:hypothetical protein
MGEKDRTGETDVTITGRRTGDYVKNGSANSLGNELHEEISGGETGELRQRLRATTLVSNYCGMSMSKSNFMNIFPKLFSKKLTLGF